jgi:hypothetical protein
MVWLGSPPDVSWPGHGPDPPPVPVFVQPGPVLPLGLVPGVGLVLLPRVWLVVGLG